MLFVHQGNNTKILVSAYRIYRACTFLLSNKTNNFLVAMTKNRLQVVQGLYFTLWYEHNRSDSAERWVIVYERTG